MCNQQQAKNDKKRKLNERERQKPRHIQKSTFAIDIFIELVEQRGKAIVVDEQTILDDFLGGSETNR